MEVWCWWSTSVVEVSVIEPASSALTTAGHGGLHSGVQRHRNATPSAFGPLVISARSLGPHQGALPHGPCPKPRQQRSTRAKNSRRHLARFRNDISTHQPTPTPPPQSCNGLHLHLNLLKLAAEARGTPSVQASSIPSFAAEDLLPQSPYCFACCKDRHIACTRPRSNLAT